MMILSQASLLLFASLAIFFCQIVFIDAQLLPESEVQGLRDVAKALGKTNWNFSVNPCSGQSGWVVTVDNAVSCNCSFVNSTVCHVTAIFLKAENLQGTLPKNLSGLPFLQQFDVTRNYLNGSIPPEWGTSKLVNISLLANRLTGSIPKELGNIITLESLVLEINQLSGKVPPELGNLINIKRLLFTSNNFTGELPATLGNLTALEDFRVSDNQFSGAIPDFIQNWKKLKKIAIQASGLSGPIPLGIASLEKITDMRITDLSGPEAAFPPLTNMTKMKTMFLRNCNLTGAIPDYLKDMSSLKELDLSFNKLSGEIPNNLVILKSIDYIFLTRNNLSGPVPDWLLRGGESIDLSYNNFTNQNPAALECQQRNVNLFQSSIGTNQSIASCLRSTHCSQPSYSLHINCGGKEVTINGTKYEDDSSVATSSSFSRSKSNWGVSTTGFFTDDNSPIDYYITSNTSKLSMNNSELYTRARLSPITLTYYAFCMGDGNYTVKLNFAEIVFTDDNTYSSLGRRVFDVYIQGELVLKDFDIANEAGGAGKEVIKTFFAYVTSNTLEIRFYWAGKGTTAIPDRGVYGPLVSAISVEPNFIPPVPPPTKSVNSISTGVIVGIAVAGTLTVVAIAGLIWWKFFLTKKSDLQRDLKGLDLKTGKFTLRQIKAATNNFDAANKIGEGGFGCVYKGLLTDGSIIAVKQLSSKSKQGNREFLNEIGMISALQHPHLVKLYGCCIEGDQLLLVYEYMENNNVGRALFGPEESQINLDWPTRSKICIGIARGLAFLHEESRLKIVHRDIKATNVLLDKNLSPKISDFGLAKLDEEENTHISTRIAGTYGYMAPEYAMRGHLTDKADVYSYGIVALEIISGRSNTTYRGKDDSFYLLDWALVLKENGDLTELVDPRLGTDYDREDVLLTINLALQCADVSPTVRPSMSTVVSILEGKAPLQDFVSDTSASKEDISEMRKKFRSTQEEIQTHSISIEGPWTGSTASVADLYPVNPDSDYWQNRN